jgi:hypothetical protein
MTIAPEGEHIFSEMATVISIDDEADGEYLIIEQPCREKANISINPDEWETIKSAIEQMLAEMAEYEKSISPKL